MYMYVGYPVLVESPYLACMDAHCLPCYSGMQEFLHVKYALLNSNVWVHATCIHTSAVHVFLYLYVHTIHSLLVVKPIILTIFPPIVGLATCS